MANSLEKFFLAKVKMMPPVEVDLTQQMVTKKSDPPKKVLPPGSSQSALAIANNKDIDSKPSPIKTVQHGLLPQSVSQTSGIVLNQCYKTNEQILWDITNLFCLLSPFL